MRHALLPVGTVLQRAGRGGDRYPAGCPMAAVPAVPWWGAQRECHRAGIVCRGGRLARPPICAGPMAGPAKPKGAVVEICEEFGPVYNVASATLVKFRGKARGGL